MVIITYLYRYTMNIYDKFTRKYGSPPKTVMLPPPIKEESPSPLEGNLRSEKLSPFLQQFVLEEGEDALDPSTFEEFEPEITKDRRYDVLPQEVAEGFQDLKKEVEEGSYKPPKASQEQATVPPGPRKHAVRSSDEVLKLCSKFHDLCCKF